MSVYSLCLDILLIASVKLKTIKKFFILSSTKNAVTAFGVMNILFLYNWKYLKTLKLITLKMINFLVPRCSSAPRCPCRAQQNCHQRPGQAADDEVRPLFHAAIKLSTVQVDQETVNSFAHTTGASPCMHDIFLSSDGLYCPTSSQYPDDTLIAPKLK